MTDYKEIKSVLAKLVSQLEAIAPYADALYSQNKEFMLAKDKTGAETSTMADAGVKIRAFDGQQYHETCVQGWQPQLLQTEVHALVARLKTKPVVGKTVTIKLERDNQDKEFFTHAKIDPTNVSVKEKTDAVTTIYDKAMQQSKEFVNCRVVYREETEERVFVNRYKKLAGKWIGCSVLVVPFVQTPDGQTRHDYFSNFANGFEVKDLPEEHFKTFLQRAIKVKSAGKIPAGKYTAILSPNVSGLLAHESFGHGMESDVILRGRAKAEEFLGKRIAAAKVNICDDPSLPGCHGTLLFDDEGMMPRRVFMVKSGIVTEPITESFSAAKRGFARTANARAESFDHKIYARMSNTFFLGGKDNLKDMLKSVKNGIFLHQGGSGMEDPKGWGVQVAGILCERIKNGKLTGEFFYEASMTGYLPTVLGNIMAISKEFEVKGNGMCGKGHKEFVRVSEGGPYLLIKELDLS